MRCDDERFRNAAGPYLLGALDASERAEFDRHLAGCTACRAELVDLRPVVAALGTLSEDEVVRASTAGLAGPDPTPGTITPGSMTPGTAGSGLPGPLAVTPMPDTLLPGLLARAAKFQRRRKVLLGTLGGIAAAAVVALTVVLVTGTSRSPASSTAAESTHVMVLDPVHGGPVHATATVADMPWGTEITLHCHYQDKASSPTADGSGSGRSGSGEYSSSDAAPVYSLRVVDASGSVHDVGSWAAASNQDTVFTGGTSVPMSQIKHIDVMASDGSMVLTGAG